jgi:hypothetical protein
MPYYDVTVTASQRVTIAAPDERAARRLGVEAINAANDLPEGIAISPFLITATVVTGPITVAESSPEQAEAARVYRADTVPLAARDDLQVVE